MITLVRACSLAALIVLCLSSCAYITKGKSDTLHEVNLHEVLGKEDDEASKRMAEISLLYLNQDEATEYIKAFAYETVRDNNLTTTQSCSVIPKDIMYVPGYKAFPFWGNASYVASCTKAVMEKWFIPIKKNRPKKNITEMPHNKAMIEE